MSNQITVDEMMNKLDELAMACQAWRQGTLKASNDELNSLLNRCVLLYRDVFPSMQLNKKLSAGLKLRGIKCNAGAKLPTRVVRWVFGADEPQEYVYAKVIRIAAVEMPEAQSMGEWLLRNGGLTQIASRDEAGTDKRQRRLNQIELGRTHLATAPTLATLPADIPSLQATSDDFGRFAVALVRRSDAGAYEVVYGATSSALVDALLQLVGKSAEQRENAKVATAAANEQAVAVGDVVEAISAELAA